MKLTNLTLIAMSCACLALTACGNEQTEETSQTGTSSTGASSEPAWLLASAPAEWREIADAKQDASQGDQIVLRGRIGGRDNPITAGSPAFVMMDVSIPSCADGEDDLCPKPWDYCCETRETIAANIATVIVVDENGNPIGSDLTAVGLEPLDEVVVVGTVEARPNPTVLTIRATGIHKKQG